MNKYIYKILLLILFILVITLILTTETKAASLTVTPSARTVQPGQKFTITVTASNGAGTASLSAKNASLSKSSTGWLDNSSEKITCTAGNTNGATITISVSGVIADYTTEKDQQKSTSTSITIKKKETPKPTPKATPTPKPTVKPTPKPTTTPKVTDDFYITKLVLKGVKENGEKTDIELSPKFSKNKYEYTCNVENDIQKLELEKDAGKYTKYITVKGLDELKEGENTITVTLSTKNQKTKTYTIKLTKKAETVATSNEPEEQSTDSNLNNVENNITEVEKKDKEPIMVSMPLGAFIAMQAGIIVVEVIAIVLVNKKLHRGRRY